jgi:alpha-tubulin suppressor-like RCC1 family protein
LSTVAPSSPLLLAASLYSPGATVDNAVLASQSLYWQEQVGVQASGPSLTKTGAVGWNAGAATLASLADNGYAEFSTAEATTDKFVALSHTDPGQDLEEFQYGLYLSSSAGVNVYEGGVLQASVGAYAPGDLFRIQVHDNQVTYLQNGAVIHVSAALATLPLLLNASLYTPGATVENVVIAREPTIALAQGLGFTLTLTSTGSVWAVGDNYSGYLGDGTTTNRSFPVRVANLENATAICAGADHAMALRSDGTVSAWGSNQWGQLGDGTITTRTTPVQVVGLDHVTAISAGESSSFALKSDGSVWAWGWNNSGELGDGTTTPRSAPVQILTGVIAISSQLYESLALKSDGTVWVWGGYLNAGPTPSRVLGLGGVVAVAAGGASLALTSDGSVYAWGYNSEGGVGDGTTMNRTTPVRILGGATAVAAGSGHGMALKSDGSVWAWGENVFGQVGDGSWTDRLIPVKVVNLNGVTRISGNGANSVALKSDASVWAWGDNEYGQLADGTATNRNAPVRTSF